MDEKPSPVDEVVVPRESLQDYTQVRTSTGPSDFYYYKQIPNGSDAFYGYISQEYAYPIEFDVSIYIQNGDPISSGYSLRTTTDGNKVPYYVANQANWFMYTNTDSMIQIDYTKVDLTINNPNNIIYTYTSINKTFTSSITMPNRTYTNQEFGIILSQLLQTDLSSKVTHSVNINIQFEPIIKDQPLVSKYSFVISGSTPFQLILKNNEILGPQLGLDSKNKEIVMNTVYEPGKGTVIPEILNPSYLLYSYQDSSLSYTEKIQLLKTTPVELCTELASELLKSINSSLSTSYPQGSVIVSYTGGKYTFSLINMKSTSKITLLFNTTIRLFCSLNSKTTASTVLLEFACLMVQVSPYLTTSIFAPS